MEKILSVILELSDYMRILYILVGQNVHFCWNFLHFGEEDFFKSYGGEITMWLCKRDEIQNCNVTSGDACFSAKKERINLIQIDNNILPQYTTSKTKMFQLLPSQFISQSPSRGEDWGDGKSCILFLFLPLSEHTHFSFALWLFSSYLVLLKFQQQKKRLCLFRWIGE